MTQTYESDSNEIVRRYRVSDRLSGTLTTIFEGKLDKRFYPYFDYLLDSEHSPEEQSHFYDIYVENADLEERIRKRLTSPISKISAITGARGVGKSTSMRYFFGVSTQPKLKMLSDIIPNNHFDEDERCLLIPFYLDTANISISNVQRVLTSQIQAAAELLVKESDVKFDDEAIFDFVHTHKSSLVTFATLPPNASPFERMQEFRISNQYGYVTELLKYALFKTNTPRIVLIVDDIESSEYSVQKEIVKGVMKLRDCLKNVGRLKRFYVPSYFFTCRPATFELLKSEPEIDGFSVGHAIEIRKPATLTQIVEKRFDYALKMIGEGKTLSNMGQIGDVKNRDSWEEAYGSFRAIMQRLATYTETMIVDLCNQDVRRALMDFQATLRNSRWYETDHLKGGAFKVEEAGFSFASSGIIRAFVLRDHEFYSDEIDTVVPNLFRNRENPDYDLFLMHIIKFFFERTRSQRVVSIKRNEVKSALKCCYSADIITDYFDEIIDYAKKYEILREERVKHSNGRITTYIIPMTKSFRLWKACKLGSVFLEFFRDNTFLQHKLIVDYPTARSKGTSSLPDLQKLVLCADFVFEMAKSERQVHKFVRKNNQQKRYLKYFGARSISEHIYWGLRNSTRRRYPSNNGRSTIPKPLARQITRIRNETSRARLVRKKNNRRARRTDT